MPVGVGNTQILFLTDGNAPKMSPRRLVTDEPVEVPRLRGKLTGGFREIFGIYTLNRQKREIPEEDHTT